MAPRTRNPQPASNGQPEVTPETIKQMAEQLKAARAALRAQKASKDTTIRDLIRKVDEAIIVAAGQIVTKTVPEEHRAEVAKAIANQLNGLSRPTRGWPGTLPRPDRAGWKAEEPAPQPEPAK